MAATFAHDEIGIRGLCAALVRHEVKLVAIERPDGLLLVDRLLNAGIGVVALHPNQVAASRDRFRASGGKSDQFDRFVLCELARTDAHRFRVLEPDSDQTKALRAREDLVTARVAMANQLRAELDRFWPGPARMFSAIDSPVCLAFLAKYPSPQDAKALGEKRLVAFLKAHHSTKATSASQLLARLRDALSGRAGETETARRRSIVVSLVRTLAVMVDEIKRLESEIADALDAHPDGPGYAMDDGEQEVSVRCVAVSVSGLPALTAISFSGPATRLTNEAVREYLPLLKGTAGELSASMAVDGGEREPPVRCAGGAARDARPDLQPPQTPPARPACHPLSVCSPSRPSSTRSGTSQLPVS